MYSTLRQVPDNQEVFVDSNTEQSLIVEILEMVSTESEFARYVYHLRRLALPRVCACCIK